MGSVRSWAARAITVSVSLLAVVLLWTPEASAHAVFVSANPRPGATLPTAPTSVRMVFSEPLNASLSGIRLYASSGHQVQPRSHGVDPSDPRAYSIMLPRLRPDRYAVVWHTVSEIDGHSRRGSYTFTVDNPDGSPPRIHRFAAAGVRAPPQMPTSGQAAAMWLGLAGLFLLTGSVLVEMLGTGLGVVEIPQVRRWLRRLFLAAAACLVAGTVGELIADWAPSGWRAAPLRAILTSSAGRWWEVRLAATAVVVGAWLRATRRGRFQVHAAQAIGAGVVAFSFAATAHGAASARATLGLGFEFAHIVASSVWLGGALAVAVVWALSARAARERRALLRRYSIVAAVAVPAVLASGLGNTVLELGAVDDLVTSSYGVSLLAKLVVVLALLGVAAVNAILLRPAEAAGRPQGRRLNRTIAIEAALGLAVLVPTGVLSVLAPSRPTDQAQAAADRIQSQSDPAHAFAGSTRLDGRRAELTVTPAAVGVNSVRVEVDGDYAASTLRVSITGPGHTSGTDLRETGHDHDPETHTIFEGPLRIQRSGTWQAILSRRGTGTGVPVIMPVSPPVAPPTASTGRDDLGSWLGLIALAGLGVMLAAAARALPGRRRKVGVLTLAGTGIVAAVVWAGTLALRTGAASPTVQPAGWGQPRVVHPTSLSEARVWRMPTPRAGLMTPAIAPDGSVWVAEMDSDKLARLDPRRNVVREFRFPGGYRETMGLAVADDGRVWMAQEHAMALGMFDPATARYREFPIPGGTSAPVGIAVGRQGDVWFTQMSGNKIGRFDPSTARFTEYPIPTPSASPYWLAPAPDGRVWFTEFGTGKVGALDPRTGRIHEYAVPGHPNIPGIAVAGRGTVWFTTIQGSLFRLTPSSGRMKRLPLPAAGDYGVAVGPHGTVWVGRQGGRNVYSFLHANHRFQPYRLPPGSAPWWPTVDEQGHIWVALASDRGNGLAELHPS